MSYRHTFVTQFLYKYGGKEDLKAIEDVLSKYCRAVFWQGDELGVGYFHGVIKELRDGETKEAEDLIIKDLEAYSVVIKINYE